MSKQPKQSSQLDKFKDAARDLECDDDEQRFKERLGKLVKQKPAGKPRKS
jgi:hypothetical protein